MLQIILILLMNLYAIPLIILWTLLGISIFPMGYIIFKVFLREKTALIMRRFVWIYGKIWQVILSPFVYFDYSKIDNQMFTDSSVLVVNHRSYFDTYCMSMLPIDNVCFGIRAWPFKIYFYRFFMFLAEYMNVEASSWDDITAHAGRNLTDRGFVLLFPEGHRSRDGHMTKFHSGAFRLALEHGVPLIPLCLTGTEHLLPPGRYWFEPCHIRLETLRPVFPNTFDNEIGHLAMKKQTVQFYKDHLNKQDT